MENYEISVMVLHNLNQLRSISAGNMCIISRRWKLAFLLIVPKLQWCLVVLRGHLTDERTQFLPSESSYWLVSYVTNELIKVWTQIQQNQGAVFVQQASERPRLALNQLNLGLIDWGHQLRTGIVLGLILRWFLVFNVRVPGLFRDVSGARR